jgi:hypothetical protein
MKKKEAQTQSICKRVPLVSCSVFSQTNRPESPNPKINPTAFIQVRDSTAQLRDDLENGTGASDPDVRALVTSLLRNYRLKESLDAALALGSLSGAAKDGATAHAKAAVEDLAIIIEVK